MLKIDGNNIFLTRGDSAHISVNIANNATAETYEIQESDTLILTVRESTVETSPVLVQKRITGSKDFYITPEDTKGLSVKSYKYDVELHSGDDVYTVIQCSDFKLLPEVTIL